MRITENRLRRIIRSLIKESLEEDKFENSNKLLYPVNLKDGFGTSRYESDFGSYYGPGKLPIMISGPKSVSNDVSGSFQLVIEIPCDYNK